QLKSPLKTQSMASLGLTSIVLVLVMVTFIGEAIRAAFDPKKFTRYV
ncbi:MAG: ABC transporter permease, partial [Pseudomonadota bacterium]